VCAASLRFLGSRRAPQEKDNTFVGAVATSLLTESLYAYQCMSLYASRGEVLLGDSIVESVAYFCFRHVSLGVSRAYELVEVLS